VGRIPREVVDAVRDRTDLVEVVSRHVGLKRRGRSFVGLCPFHQEKTPSFNVIPEKGIFHCFGCQAGGDAFKFLMMMDGLSFVEAVKELAGAVGIEVEDRQLTDAERRALQQRATLFDVLEAAAAFYESVLWTRPEGAPGRAYLAERGLTDETIRTARLGFAPPGWTVLVDTLHRQGYPPGLVQEAGLARPSKRGSGSYDTLRERVTIPIRDERRRVIAFGGRLLEGDGPKYLNTPESRLYHKSRVLYGLDHARAAIGRKKRCLVVEGYFDVISLVQHGFEEAVATCGTSLTSDHLERVRRLTRDVVLLMDSDVAGTKAAARSLPLFVDAGIQPWRVELPGAKDPDELVREEGPEALEAALEAREPLFEWVVSRKLAELGASSMSRDRVLEDILPMLRKLADPTLISRVARRLGLHEEVVHRQLRQAPAPTMKADPTSPPPARSWKPHVDVVHLLWLLIWRRDQVGDLLAAVSPQLLAAHEEVRPALARLLSGEPVAAVIEDTTDDGVQRTLRAVVAREKLYTEEQAPEALVSILVKLVTPLRKAAIGAWEDRVRQAERTGDVTLLVEASGQRKKMHTLRRDLDHALRQANLTRCLDLIGEIAELSAQARQAPPPRADDDPADPRGTEEAGPEPAEDEAPAASEPPPDGPADE